MTTLLTILFWVSASLGGLILLILLVGGPGLLLMLLIMWIFRNY